MNKTLSILASLLFSVTLFSCESHSDDSYLQTYPRNMVVATVNPAGYTVYTATVFGYKFDVFKQTDAELMIGTINMPDKMIYTSPRCLGLTLGTNTTSVGYTLKSNSSSWYEGFLSNMPLQVTATLSSLGWASTQTSNASAYMEFINGVRLSAFCSELAFMTNTTVTDTENPTADPFHTNDVATNNVRIEITSPYEFKANIYMYNANFDKNMKKKIDFVIENVTFEIVADRGILALKTDEAIPYLLTNNIKGDPMPSYKITDLECSIYEGFNTPGLFRFKVGDRYELSAQLTESLPEEK
ncbi:MAG: hypothetical protein NC343_08655 [Muribaculum sp.]|nr:hypothetical protein [Muribaculaceae bacterium]MCM1081803.1 hypothetical protein [Muribaculum sp.]